MHLASKPRILVVDDQVSNIVQLRQILGPGIETYAATSGTQALEVCKAVRPDLMILDVQMPGIDGLETCRLIRADIHTQELPVIFVTAGSSVAEEDACWAAGGSDFVLKPINAATLQHRIKAQLRLKMQADELRRLAFADGLTGLANRRSFDQRLSEECHRAARNVTSLSVLLLDVDYFKLYNDYYGHVAGDACLREIGNCLRRSASRPGDLMARFGGEEFVALLPETNHAGAMAVAQAILDLVKQAELRHVASPISPIVSVSIGVVTWAGQIDPVLHGSCTTLIEEADRQLYFAKQAGRARAVGREIPRI